MKRAVGFAASIVMLVTIGVGAGSAQESLAQAAKNAQAQKKATPAKKVYTNDDIASVVIPASEKAPEALAPKDETAMKTTVAKPADKSGEDQKAAEMSAATLKQLVLDQQAKVKDSERELNLMEREHQVRVAAYYADAGNQLRDSTKWFADEKKYNDDLAAKKKYLADAKEKLANVQEDARKAGIPLGQLE